MNFKILESNEKLGGVYYTPSDMSGFIARWVCSATPLSILEPSCGEGIFIESLEKKCIPRNVSLTICDIDSKALRCSIKKADKAGFTDVRYAEGDFISWSIGELLSSSEKRYDAILGNPPFIRYQYLDKKQQNSTQDMYAILGKKFTKHANIWAAFVMAAINLLNPGGRLAMVIPEEITNVLYAKEVRDSLLETCSKTVLVSPKNRKFEGTLQGTVVLFAEKKMKGNNNPGLVGIYEAECNNNELWAMDPEIIFNTTTCRADLGNSNKWIELLLNEEEYVAYNSLKQHLSIKKFNCLAKAEVGIVTGANSYFLVPDKTVEKYGLHEVAHPMFGRSSHCPGILYDKVQHEENSRKNYPTNFILFNGIEDEKKYNAYLKIAHPQGIPERYKCRIRDPWYKVPSVYSTEIAMLKRSSDCPRLIYNSINAYTTDTAYRVRPNPDIDAESLVRCFQNSLTALSAEIEGRFYGGGVLELVPSEIKNLLVPYTSKVFISINQLNEEVKSLSTADLLKRQDERICKMLNISTDDMRIIRGAWQKLSRRRQA